MLTVLRALRLHSGMTGTTLGAEVGRSYQWAMAVEKGRLPVPPLMQILIGGLFDISASEIFDSTGKAKILDVPAMLGSLPKGGAPVNGGAERVRLEAKLQSLTHRMKALKEEVDATLAEARGCDEKVHTTI